MAASCIAAYGFEINETQKVSNWLRRRAEEEESETVGGILHDVYDDGEVMIHHFGTSFNSHVVKSQRFFIGIQIGFPGSVIDMDSLARSVMNDLALSSGKDEAREKIANLCQQIGIMYKEPKICVFAVYLPQY